MSNFKILVLDDECSLVEEICGFLEMEEHQCFGAVNPTQAFEVLKNENIDAAIVDVFLPEMSGIEVMAKIKQDYPLVEIIAITGQGDMQTVIESFRNGAIDFFSKPFSLYDLTACLERVSMQLKSKMQDEISELNHHLLASNPNESNGYKFVGNSPEMKKVIELVSRVAQTDSTTVLITGESGTGKELVARGIHALSNRRNNYFHSVNCSAIPESLFESEFFGHQKGAFSGAIENTSGWFEISQNGTLFLDEIAELPLTTQAKFLRVLDNKIISKIGAKKEISLDLRIIAATNKSLPEMVEQRLFRNDLFHRLNAFIINIPPLRDHSEDIPDLINYFVNYFNKSLNKNIKTVDEKLVRKLMEYSFPGNVRELKNIIEQAMILCDGNILTMKNLMINSRIKLNDNKVDVTDYELDKIEKIVIIRAMKYAGLNKSKAARSLNISRQALNRKLEKHQITNEMMT